MIWLWTQNYSFTIVKVNIYLSQKALTPFSLGSLSLPLHTK